ncbi:hypothetical protein [Nakamurella panacisegetis]|uniref:hypothetical protein n=1 Tax=Nakamurella panacisegetis TaxID=1090615 RepID=UPI0012FDB1B9|nr:hypothetical protein [Nakamurella panacisegetis]
MPLDPKTTRSSNTPVTSHAHEPWSFTQRLRIRGTNTSFNFDPEVAAILAQMGGSKAAPPAVRDIEGRRAFWEPILAASSTAQSIPRDVRMTVLYGADIRRANSEYA